MKIAHLADVHFGRIARCGIVEALVADVASVDADLIIVSGDLTQRARKREYEQAAMLLRSFTAPVLVVPGNHDVYAWWHPFHRLVAPLRRFRRYICEDPSPTFTNDEVSVLGITSACGWTIQRGWCGAPTRRRIGSFFAGQPEGKFRILVVHHPLAAARSIGAEDVALGGAQTLRAAAEAKVDLVLSGHWHLSHAAMVSEFGGDPFVVAITGTATSDRWRAPQERLNQYQAIDVLSEHIVIEARQYDPCAHAYEFVRRSNFARDPRAGGGMRA